MNTRLTGRAAATTLGVILALTGCAADRPSATADQGATTPRAVAPAAVVQAAPAVKVAATATPQITHVRKGQNVPPVNGVGVCGQAPGCPKVLFDISGFAPGSVWTVSASSADATVTSSAKLTVNSAGTGYSWAGYIVFAHGTGPVTVTLSGTRTYTSAAVAW